MDIALRLFDPRRTRVTISTGNFEAFLCTFPFWGTRVQATYKHVTRPTTLLFIADYTQAVTGRSFCVIMELLHRLIPWTFDEHKAVQVTFATKRNNIYDSISSIVGGTGVFWASPP